MLSAFNQSKPRPLLQSQVEGSKGTLSLPAPSLVEGLKGTLSLSKGPLISPSSTRPTPPPP